MTTRNSRAVSSSLSPGSAAQRSRTAGALNSNAVTSVTDTAPNALPVFSACADGSVVIRAEWPFALVTSAHAAIPGCGGRLGGDSES